MWAARPGRIRTRSASFFFSSLMAMPLITQPLFKIFSLTQFLWPPPWIASSYYMAPTSATQRTHFMPLFYIFTFGKTLPLKRRVSTKYPFGAHQSTHSRDTELLEVWEDTTALYWCPPPKDSLTWGNSIFL